MELRSVEELMDLLYACQGVTDTPVPGGEVVDRHDLALRSAALLRRSRPADKELQVTALVQPIGRLLQPGEARGGADRAADAVRGLLGERVAGLVRRYPWHGGPADDDVLSLRHAEEESRSAWFDAGVLEDWRTVLELLAARNSRLGAVD
ncbi:MULTISPECIES: hypothetical protein [unclassified Streptomyces]|uniref:hypothetical protein n=1 Tax=unclassified Streptomyces TaxID=2593676 RepID=UPI001F03ADFC|nr:MULTISPECIES: hypothetical protein [unclassified Streptomyces]MCH0564560.1 hypothetical protein [Streptomyces sp. MUM 2J]MCH0572267.1 hypothetical protein [Streptomyces sp. MUM 136J]